ncbi:hypothetical protein TSUD_10680 [Trifolium subterraneum]|nr:hypothetical protein TSUD_10680 [Trifolium subterraneum]
MVIKQTTTHHRRLKAPVRTDKWRAVTTRKRPELGSRDLDGGGGAGGYDPPLHHQPPLLRCVPPLRVKVLGLEFIV